MKKIFYFLCLLLITFSSFAQLQLHSGASLQMHANANLSVVGGITNNGTFSNNLGKLWLVGTSLQTIDGNNLIQVNQLELNNSAGMKLDNELQLSDQLTFSNGIITSDIADTATEFVHFLAGSSYTGSADDRHIDGVVKKTGNTAFTFPTGDNGRLMPISIGATTSVSDEFRAYYRYENPYPNIATYGSLDITLDHTSTKEYWILDRTNGASAVQLTLAWNDSSEVEEPADLVIAHWDGSIWENMGGVDHSGSNASGTLKSAGPISSFSPFTLASTSAANPLPITLVYFNAHKANEKEVALVWETASELNNDYFTIERMNTSRSWEILGTVNGAGNSTSTLKYSFTDFAPNIGENYYRLKQTDYDGTAAYSKPRRVTFKSTANDFIVYPNPANEYITIVSPEIQFNDIRIHDFSGKLIQQQSPLLSAETSQLKLDISNLSKGIYFISISNTKKRLIIL